MRFLIITGNPKADGLCHAITEQVVRGAKDGGAQTDILNTGGFNRCKVCGEGWGICWEQKVCKYGGEDGFDDAQKRIADADMLCIISPVYWGEMTESLKAFMDRLRRCEWGAGKLENKKVLLIASPGGNGGNPLTCIEEMERYTRTMRAKTFDWIAVNRWNNDYKAEAAYAAAKAMAEGRNVGDTVGHAEEMKQTLGNKL